MCEALPCGSVPDNGIQIVAHTAAYGEIAERVALCRRRQAWAREEATEAAIVVAIRRDSGTILRA